jgi:hypothetical protein
MGSSRSSNVCGVHYEIHQPASPQAASKLKPIRSQPRQNEPEFEGISGVGSRVRHFTISATIARSDHGISIAVRVVHAIALS